MAAGREDGLPELPNRPLKKIDLEALKLLTQARRWDVGVAWAGRILTVLAAALPLWLLRSTIEAFAGETTKLDIGISIVITLGVTGVAAGEGWYARYLRGQIRERDKEIRRLKERLDETESARLRAKK